MLYSVLFVLGTAETLADTASGTLLVGVVNRDDLGRANARLFATFTLGNQLLGPPVGALMAMASPRAARAGSIAVMNMTLMAAFATWVLYARERLGLSDLGFGLLIAAGAVGGLSGSWAYRHLEARCGRVLLVRAGLVVEAATHLVLAVTRSPIVAFVTMAVFGVHAVVWGAASTTVRQRAVPEHLLGRGD